ncbi:Hypothetical predicted protein [Cloeon dipterum]|nr:Hypothetical predicted protein [Cloeon dipterum]
MRKTLYNRAMEEIDEIGGDKVWAALPYLEQHKTTENISTKDFASMFRLESVLGTNFRPGATMEEFLQYLVECVPNLRQLEIQDPRTSRSKKRTYNKIELQPLATGLLLKMKNLTQVSLNDVSIQFSGFVSVCTDSQNLQSIKAKEISIDKKTIISMKNILETLDSKFDYQEYNGQMFPIQIGITLKKTNAGMPFRKVTATLSDDFLDRIPSRFMHLQICSMGNRDIVCERNYLLRILEKEGANLKTLGLKFIRRALNLTFKDIFEHCNELETLNLFQSFISENDSIASFGQLKKFEWENTNRNVSLRLATIFSAPLLQEVDIISFNIKLGDKDSLFSKISNRMILTNFTKIQIQNLVNNIGEYDPSIEEMAELESVLNSLGGIEVSIRSIFVRLG